jgi:YVTN family beta-propeller protein
VCSSALARSLFGAIFFLSFWCPRAGAQSLPPSITVGNAPVGIAVNPITNKIYVANQSDNTVGVIHGGSLTLSASAALETTPSGEPDLWSWAKCMFHDRFFRT